MSVHTKSCVAQWHCAVFFIRRTMVQFLHAYLLIFCTKWIIKKKKKKWFPYTICKQLKLTLHLDMKMFLAKTCMQCACLHPQQSRYQLATKKSLKKKIYLFPKTINVILTLQLNIWTVRAITSVYVKLCKMEKCAHFTQYEQKKLSHQPVQICTGTIACAYNFLTIFSLSSLYLTLSSLSLRRTTLSFFLSSDQSFFL